MAETQFHHWAFRPNFIHRETIFNATDDVVSQGRNLLLATKQDSLTNSHSLCGHRFQLVTELWIFSYGKAFTYSYESLPNGFR
jgi:hypothetical protein